MTELLLDTFAKNGLLTSFAVVGATMYISYVISSRLTKGRIHGSAIAILLGLVLAYIGGVSTGGQKGLADLQLFSGIGLMGGAMLRDFAIVSTAFGASFEEVKKAGASGILSLFLGIVTAYAVGLVIAWSFGYTDAVSLATIGAGAVTYIVGPVTGAALGASSEVIALSIAAGLVKSVLVMIGTPFAAKYIGLNNPRTALIFGGMLGTTSGVTGGLAATDPRLVPYGAVTSTFYTGLGCLLCPSVLFLITKSLFG